MRDCDDTCTFDCGRCKGRVKRRLVIDIEVAKNNTHKVLHCGVDAVHALKEIGVVVINCRNEPRE